MFTKRPWVDGLVVFLILAASVWTAMRLLGLEVPLKDLTEHAWWDWVPWLILMVFWVVVIRLFQRGTNDE